MLGLYKLSEHNLRKLLKRELTDINGNKCPGASKNEIAALIYFTHIADSSGYIEEFQTTSLAESIGCSRRDTFLILRNLHRKGFIEYTAEHWTGYGDIRVLHNDYRGVTDYNGKNRYLNTNRSFLKTGDSFYGLFRSLSLYATRMLLLILFEHNQTYGYRISHDSMASTLHIKSRSLVHKYLNEIRGLMLSDSIKENNNPKKRLHYGHFSVSAKETMLAVETGLQAEDDSYFKRTWKRKLSSLDVTLGGFRSSANELLQRLFYIISEAVSQKLSVQLIENIIEQGLREECIFNEITLARIELRLKNLIPETN